MSDRKSVGLIAEMHELGWTMLERYQALEAELAEAREGRWPQVVAVLNHYESGVADLKALLSQTQQALQHEGLRADGLAGELERVRELALTQAAKLTTAEGFTIPNLKAELEKVEGALMTLSQDDGKVERALVRCEERFNEAIELLLEWGTSYDDPKYKNRFPDYGTRIREFLERMGVKR